MKTKNHSANVADEVMSLTSTPQTELPLELLHRQTWPRNQRTRRHRVAWSYAKYHFDNMRRIIDAAPGWPPSPAGCGTKSSAEDRANLRIERGGQTTAPASAGQPLRYNRRRYSHATGTNAPLAVVA